MNLWLIMLAAGLVTFAIRWSFIGAAGRMDAPDWLVRLLRYVPIAALAALIWPDLLIADGQLTIAQPRLYAGLVAAMIAWRTRSTLATIAGGMLALWLLRWLMVPG